MVRILMVIAQNGFRDEELYDTMEVFESKGWKVDLASVTTDEARGVLGAIVKPNLAIRDAKVYEYDAVVVVGGRGALQLSDNKDAQALVKNAYDRQKIVGGICYGPLVLAKAGVLKGKKASVCQTSESIRMFQQAGVNLVKDDVFVSGTIVTANGPLVSKKFGQAISELIA